MEHAHEHPPESGMKNMDHSKMDHSKMDMTHDKMSHGSHAHHDHSGMIEDFKKRFYVSLVLTLPVLLLSHAIQEMVGVHISFAGDGYLAFALSSIIFFYGGWPFLKGLVDEVRDFKPGMMTLIAIAITVAYAYSSAVVFGLKGMDFFWELATLIDVMLIGHWIEMRSVAGASKALELLVQLMPSEAHMVHGDHIMEVKVADLKVENIILVKPGEKIPADGIIIEGESYLNEAMLTGESKPVLKKLNDKIIGGSINGNGSLKVKIEHTGSETYLSKVIKLVGDAQNIKSKTQHLADKAAFWLAIFALTAGFGTFFTWLALGKDFAFAIERMVTVMVISCPHALGLAIPLVVAISTAIAAQKGLLIRNRTAFENARKITTIVFDKTGTLTKGTFEVTRMVSKLSEFTDQNILSFAAALEQNSEHPIAEGIVKKAKELNIALSKAEKFNAITGKGIEGEVEGKQVKVVSPGFMKENGLDINDVQIENETVVFVLVNDAFAGYIALADAIRPESAEAIKTLKSNGIKTIMLTGDNQKVAESVSKALGLDGFFAEVLPDQKLQKIKEMQARGEFVAMTGDGVNDAPALAQADIGIAIGSGTDIAAETADIILVNSNPQDIVSLILFGKATYNKMIQNLIWATAYNVITLPLATGFVAGIMISPAIGAGLMSLSTIIVAINAQTLKRFKTNKIEA